MVSMLYCVHGKHNVSAQSACTRKTVEKGVSLQ